MKESHWIKDSLRELEERKDALRVLEKRGNALRILEERKMKGTIRILEEKIRQTKELINHSRTPPINLLKGWERDCEVYAHAIKCIKKCKKLDKKARHYEDVIGI